MKVGIISHYYGSTNYGGVLQSYALCRVLAAMGHEPEQICFPLRGAALPWQRIERSFHGKCLLFLREGRLISKASNRLKRAFVKAATKAVIPDLRSKRKESFYEFCHCRIPHSLDIYDSETVAECENRYDVFITGSDQVWNLKWYNPAYFLDFAGVSKPKFSYAASISMDRLDLREKGLFRKLLKDYIGISVREVDSVELLQGLSPCEVVSSLDPTLLLDKNQWDEVCAERMVEDDYLFCYFLGGGFDIRHAANRFAKSRGLKVVTIPYLDGEFRLSDVAFGDIRLPFPSPEEFLSLVKNAQVVFADSFHAVVFSLVYEKDFIVFPRLGQRGMDLRIRSLLGAVGLEGHFCDSPERIEEDYISVNYVADYTGVFSVLEAEKLRSMAYLEHSMDIAGKVLANGN